MKTSELFEKEINYIKSEKLRKVVAEVLDIAPVCILLLLISSVLHAMGSAGLINFKF